jgi:hypothetical protein
MSPRLCSGSHSWTFVSVSVSEFFMTLRPSGKRDPASFFSTSALHDCQVIQEEFRTL